MASAAKNYQMAIRTHLNQKILSEDAKEAAKREMGLTYSRGFFSGWLNGVDHQRLVDGTFGAHRGVEIGVVSAVGGKSVKIKSSYRALKKGDGILLAGSLFGKKVELGGMLYDVKNQGSDFELFFSHDFDLKKIQIGWRVYFNHDAAVEKSLTQSYTDKKAKKKIPLTLIVQSSIGSPLKIAANDGDHEVIVESDSIAEEAKARPLSKEDLKAELGALGATCFSLESLEVSGDSFFFIHQRELKNLRRKFTEELMNLRITRSGPELCDVDLQFNSEKQTKVAKRHFNLLLRELDQVKELLLFADELKDILGIGIPL